MLSAMSVSSAQPAGFDAAADKAVGVELFCPSCRTALRPTGTDQRTCPRCHTNYARASGIWLMLGEERRAFFRQFVHQYETVRRAEDRAMQSAEQLRALPFRDLSRRRRRDWAIRSRSFAELLRVVIEPLEGDCARSLRVLDLGSGVGWLAYRMARRGHDAAAVDLLTNDFDGLGVHRYYDHEFLPVQAEFDSLPFGDASFDVAVYNASFHYACDCVSTLREAVRVLAPAGQVVIMDTPLYRDASSGRAMVREREAEFHRRFGFRADALKSEGFLTYDRLEVLAGESGLQWELSEPWYGVRWWLKPALARIRGLREPARFKLIVGRRTKDIGRSGP
jgi:SAM-dependent methyltransferase